VIRERKYNQESGQGLLEFALVLPILLLVLVGLAEFARIFAIYTNLFNAAREGTRYPWYPAGNAVQDRVCRSLTGVHDDQLRLGARHRDQERV
jgi:hypothetical protein